MQIAASNPNVHLWFGFEPCQTLRPLEECSVSAKARVFPRLRNLLNCREITTRKEFVALVCQHGSAAFAVACPFCGTQERISRGSSGQAACDALCGSG
jgi:hypothetical protein